jgi:hypothetical protein
MEQNLKRDGHSHHHGFGTSAHSASTRQLHQSAKPEIDGGAQSAKPDLKMDVQRLKAKPEICRPTYFAVRGPMHGKFLYAFCNSTFLEPNQSADSEITMRLAMLTAARCKTRTLMLIKQLSLSSFLYAQAS